MKKDLRTARHADVFGLAPRVGAKKRRRSPAVSPRAQYAECSCAAGGGGGRTGSSRVSLAPASRVRAHFNVRAARARRLGILSNYRGEAMPTRLCTHAGSSAIIQRLPGAREALVDSFADSARPPFFGATDRPADVDFRRSAAAGYLNLMK